MLATIDIYPLKLPDEPVPTAIHEVEATAGTPVYYDLTGHRSMSPHDGFNIVVKRQGQHIHVSKIYR